MSHLSSGLLHLTIMHKFLFFSRIKQVIFIVAIFKYF